MDRLLVTSHMHVLALITGILFVPSIVGALRKRHKLTAFTQEENNKLRLDVATTVPISVLLWNLSIFYVTKILPAPVPAAAAAAQAPPQLTFEGAIAHAGESVVALATAIIFCRLLSAIWAEVKRP